MRKSGNFIPLAIGLVILSALPVSARHTSNDTGSTAGSQRSAMDSQSSSSSSNADSKKKHGTRATVNVEIAAPTGLVWQVLTDFSKYPQIFKRIESCRVTKREGDLVFTETNLRPQMFLKQPIQHAVNDLGAGPNVLTWRAIDGNFKSLDGKWELKPAPSGNKCIAYYTLEVDAGNCVPAPLVGFALRSMQKEIVNSLKTSAEQVYEQERDRTSKLPPQKPQTREAS